MRDVRSTGNRLDQRLREGPALLHDDVLPTVSDIPGFVSGVWLAPVDGKGMEILIFETEDEARAMAEQMPPGRKVNEFVTVESVEMREVAGRVHQIDDVPLQMTPESEVYAPRDRASQWAGSRRATMGSPRGGGSVMGDGGVQEGRKLSGGAIAALGGVAVLLIFVLQNTADVRFHFLFLDFTWPLWLYTIVTALFGALVWFGFGVMRRHRRRKERREDRRD